MNSDEMVDIEIAKILSPKKGKAFYEEMSEKDTTLRMGLNENMLIDKSFSGMLLNEAAKRVDARRYPIPKGGLAIRSIAEDLGIWEDQVVVGNGSDEILDLIAKVFVGSKEAIIVEPTFEMYRFYVGLARGRVRPVLMNENFDLSADDVISSITDDTKVIFICSPNNPTGKQFPKDEILRIVEESGKLVVLDEAYSDFSPYSLARDATKYQNLLVLRTFSKAYGLAGLRVGFAIGNNEITSWLSAAQSPFSVNMMAQEMVRLVLENKKIYDSMIKRTVEERNYLKAELRMIKGIKAFDSDANFILFRVIGMDNAAFQVTKKLNDAGIEIRDRSTLPLLQNCLRVTVANREDNLKFVNQLVSILGEI